MRDDLQLISDWIPADASLLDLGCGDGTLLAHLKQHKQIRGYGLEINQDNLAACFEKGVNVLEQDLDEGLGNFQNHRFDYVVMTQALQAVLRPDQILNEMLRVGREAIITFPNFGHWRVRAYLGLIMYAAAALAVGLLASSMSSNQIVAAVVGTAVLLTLSFLDAVADLLSGTAHDVLNGLSMDSHLVDFNRGVVDTSNIVYYVSVAAILLFVTVRLIETRRWR